jgi:hypothetical protein
MSDTVSVRKDDLDILVAAVTSWAPHDMGTEVGEAFSRLLTAFDEAHADDDAHASEPEPAKVVVVTLPTGERRYDAPKFGTLCDGTLLIGDELGNGDLRVDAALAPGRWLDVHKDVALKDGPGPYFAQGKKLAIALDALRDVADEPHPGYAPERATEALAEIAELDL